MEQGQEIAAETLGEEGDGDHVAQPQQYGEGAGEDVIADAVEDVLDRAGVGDDLRAQLGVGIRHDQREHPGQDEGLRQVLAGNLRPEAEDGENAGADHRADGDGDGGPEAYLFGIGR